MTELKDNFLFCPDLNSYVYGFKYEEMVFSHPHLFGFNIFDESV